MSCFRIFISGLVIEIFAYYLKISEFEWKAQGHQVGGCLNHIAISALTKLATDLTWPAVQSVLGSLSFQTILYNQVANICLYLSSNNLSTQVSCMFVSLCQLAPYLLPPPSRYVFSCICRYFILFFNSFILQIEVRTIPPWLPLGRNKPDSAVVVIGDTDNIFSKSKSSA